MKYFKACTVCGCAVSTNGWGTLILIILITVQDRVLVQNGKMPPAFLIQVGVGRLRTFSSMLAIARQIRHVFSAMIRVLFINPLICMRSPFFHLLSLMSL